MQTPVERTSSEWFHEAARCYIEGHQGCAWCGRAYRVFHQRRGAKQIYYCQGCDFQAGYDGRTDTHFIVPGTAGESSGCDTMHAG